MAAGATVQSRPLPARIVADHPSQRGAIRGRNVRSEEDPVWSQVVVELIEHHAWLDPHNAGLGIVRDDAVHVLGEIDTQAVPQRSAVGAGAAAARQESNRRVARRAGQPSDRHHVVAYARKDHRLRHDLIDAVVGRGDQPRRVVAANLSGEAAALELAEKILVKRLDGGGLRHPRNHKRSGRNSKETTRARRARRDTGEPAVGLPRALRAFVVLPQPIVPRTCGCSRAPSCARRERLTRLAR